MKDYINLFHSIVSDVHFWENYSKKEKKSKLLFFQDNLYENDYLVEYFDNFYEYLQKKNLNYFLKSVINS